MKRILAFSLLCIALSAVQAQEKLPREQSLKYAFVLAANLKQMVATPIPTDPDVKRPVAVKEGNYGGMVLPEGKLNAAVFAKAGTEVIPVGQLWLVRLAPLSEGQVTPASKLRIVHFSSGDQQADANCLALGVRKASGDKLELLLFGKGTEPVMRVPLKSISSEQDTPIDMSAERRDDGGLLTLKFVGKYEASFMVTDPDQY
jgi:hypothetical protein